MSYTAQGLAYQGLGRATLAYVIVQVRAPTFRSGALTCICARDPSTFQAHHPSREDAQVDVTSKARVVILPHGDTKGRCLGLDFQTKVLFLRCSPPIVTLCEEQKTRGCLKPEGVNLFPEVQ